MCVVGIRPHLFYYDDMDKLLYTAIQRIIKQALSLPDGYIILANQNATISNDNIVITVLNVSDTGTHHAKYVAQGTLPADNFDEILQSKYNTCSMQLMFKGNNAQLYARTLLRQRSSALFKRLMRKNSFGLIEMKQITALNDILNKQNYPQAIMELSFYFADGNYIDINKELPNTQTSVIPTVVNTVNAIDVDTVNIRSQLSTPKLEYQVKPDSITVI